MEIFKNLTYEIQNIIYLNYITERETKQNKRWFNRVLEELKYINDDNDDIKDILSHIFQDTYNAGTKMDTTIVLEYEIKTDFDYDTYYKNLDYLYMCELNTNIDFDNSEINYTYNPKPNYIYICNRLKKIEDDYLNGDYDDYYELIYNCHTCCYNLYDFIEDLDLTSDNYTDMQYLNNILNERNENSMKELLFKCFDRKVFGFQLQY